ncbi:unnamed protein product [Caenorhabditis brenneri]
MSFPLRRLPFVVLSILFSCLNPEELIRLSFLSKRCYALTKALRKKPKKGLDITLDSYASIRFGDTFSKRFEVLEFSDIPKDAELEFLVIGGALPCFVSMNRERDGMDLYCQYDRFEGLKALSKYIIDFYELPIEEISFSTEKNPNDPKRALDWVFSQQESLDICHFECQKSGDEELQYLFDRIENRVQSLLFVPTTANASENFRYTFRQPITPDAIETGDMLWLTLDNLYSLNSRGLYMRKTNLTSENINSFLKNWLNGGNSNLGFLIFDMKLINVDVILNGLEVVHRDHPIGIKYFFEPEQGASFNSWYELKRSDGAIASILIEDGANDYFEMCVWPDIYGRPYPVQDSEE